jgi:hypothetical protein
MLDVHKQLSLELLDKISAEFHETLMDVAAETNILQDIIPHRISTKRPHNTSRSQLKLVKDHEAHVLELQALLEKQANGDALDAYLLSIRVEETEKSIQLATAALRQHIRTADSICKQKNIYSPGRTDKPS